LGNHQVKTIDAGFEANSSGLMTEEAFSKTNAANRNPVEQPIQGDFTSTWQRPEGVNSCPVPPDAISRRGEGGSGEIYFVSLHAFTIDYCIGLKIYVFRVGTSLYDIP